MKTHVVLDFVYFHANFFHEVYHSPRTREVCRPARQRLIRVGRRSALFQVAVHQRNLVIRGDYRL